jgi:hypothetical protein
MTESFFVLVPEFSRINKNFSALLVVVRTLVYLGLFIGMRKC